MIKAIRKERVRQNLEQEMWKYQDAARDALILGNIDSVIYFTLAWRDMEKVLKEYDRLLVLRY